MVIGALAVLFPQTQRNGGFIGGIMDKPSDIMRSRAELKRIETAHEEKMILIRAATAPRIPAWFLLVFSVTLAGLGLVTILYVNEKKRVDIITREIRRLCNDPKNQLQGLETPNERNVAKIP
jgi:hypothetical protein